MIHIKVGHQFHVIQWPEIGGGGTWGDLPAVPRTGRRRCSQYIPGHQVSSQVGWLRGIAPLTVSDRVFIFGFFHFGNPLGVRFFL